MEGHTLANEYSDRWDVEENSEAKNVHHVNAYYKTTSFYFLYEYEPETFSRITYLDIPNVSFTCQHSPAT